MVDLSSWPKHVRVTRGTRLLCRAGLLVLLASLTAAAGSIIHSKHDLAYWRDVKTYHSWDDFNQVCAYCHVPHHANQAQGALWNRPAPVSTFVLYQSPTLDNQPTQPGRGSLVCLSCHDGTIAMDTVVHRPRSSPIDLQADGLHGMMTTTGDVWANCGVFCHGGSWGDFRPHWFDDLDLSRDHPVSIAYPNTPEFVPPPADGQFTNGVRLVEGRVECVSCHDPHDPDFPPFLVASDDGSALCYTCHRK